MNVYVYYDVPPASTEVTAQRVRAMQATLGDMATRIDLLRRPEAKPDAQTWMEVYEDVTTDFEQRLVEAVAAHGLAALCGPRHIERFVPCV